MGATGAQFDRLTPVTTPDATRLRERLFGVAEMDYRAMVFGGRAWGNDTGTLGCSVGSEPDRDHRGTATYQMVPTYVRFRHLHVYGICTNYLAALDNSKFMPLVSAA